MNSKSLAALASPRIILSSSKYNDEFLSINTTVAPAGTVIPFAIYLSVPSYNEIAAVAEFVPSTFETNIVLILKII